MNHHHDCTCKSCWAEAAGHNGQVPRILNGVLYGMAEDSNSWQASKLTSN
jgi:hypothetical protein